MNITAEKELNSLTESSDMQFYNINTETSLTVHKIIQARRYS